jgi:tetratricopeptide (TPR) repeat protein
MTRRLWLAALGLLMASCVQHTQVAKAPPAPQSVWDRQIHNAIDAGDGDYQLRVLRQKLAADPDDVPIRLELAKAYLDRGYPDVALEICRLAAARFPESGEAQLALVGALRDMNHRAEAIDGLVVFLQAHPQTGPQYFSWLGILRDESSLWPLGEPAHRRALELAPSFDYLHNNLGYNLLMQKKYAEAAGEFREALKLNPRSPVARNNLGLALADLDETDQALANWQSASDPATAHNNLAAVLMEKGNYPNARKELEIALGYNNAYPAALKNLELVSRLDGHPATLAVKPAESHWRRWKMAFRRLFVGPLEDSRTDAVKTASAP